MRFVFIAPAALALVALFIPAETQAALLGPIIDSRCYCPNGAPGWGCTLQTIQNLVNFAISLSMIIAVLVIMYAGLLWILNPINAKNKEQARTMLLNAVIGLVIVLSAWLLVDTFMKIFYNESKFGPWNEVLSARGGAAYCLAPTATDGARPSPTPSTPTPTPGTPTPSTPGTGSTGSAWPATLSSSQIESRARAAKTYSSQLCAAARANGLSSTAARQVFGILGVESNGNASAGSSAGAYGLMQLLPGTAKQMDSSLSSLSDAAIIQKLKDPNYNIQLGVKYYAQMLSRFSGNVTNATAAYNAGPGSGTNSNGTRQPFSPSQNCPGLFAWECKTNSGGFAETQRYVGNVAAVASVVGNVCN